MIDRTTKILLGLIATALWVQLAAPLVKPTPAYAQMSDSYLSSIDTHITRISRGTCNNSKLC